MAPWYVWVFDGMGGAAAVAVAAAMYQRYSSNRSSKTLGEADSPIENKSVTTEPTPEQILREIKSVLPIDRDNAKQKYVGLKVVWQTSFLNLTKIGDRWYVITGFGRGFAIITVNFSMSLVPSELGSATEHSTLLIKGIVKSIGVSGDIDLESDPEVQVVKRA
jgi:hypothetical protein